MMGKNWFLRTASRATVLFLLSAVGLSHSPAKAQTLQLEIERDSLETWISNTTPTAIQVIGYSIASNAGLLDPTKWRSIADAKASDPAAVSAALGSGALTFGEIGASNASLAELNFEGFANWQPGTRWSLGFPFGKSVDEFHSHPLDAQFVYQEPAGGSFQGPIVLVPEPAATVVAMTTIALLLLAYRHRT